MNKRSKKLFMVENDSEIAGYDTILSEVIDLLESARHASARAVNVFMTASYWLIGRRIIEWEQAGKERATHLYLNYAREKYSMALPDEKVLAADLEHTCKMLEARQSIRETAR